MKRFRNLPATLVVLFAAAVIPLSVAPSASAAPSGLSDPPSSATTAFRVPVADPDTGKKYSPDLTVSRGRLDAIGGDPQVTAYWTPERMKKAIPLDTPTSTAEVDRQAKKIEQQAVEPLTRGSFPIAATASNIAPKAAPPVTNFSKTNGKVFFHNQTDGLDYVCSGSSINSDSKRLVVTAGHCVHGGPGGTWHSRWVFWPGYNNGPTYGAYQAAVLRTFNDWIEYGATGRGFNSDVGFATTYTGDTTGATIVNAVGGHGFEWGGGYGFDASVFGYPQNLSGGEIMWACWGVSGTGWVGFYEFNRISGCGFGGGSSGGPWLDEYSNSSGLGYVRSVTSHIPSPTDFSWIDGPYFDGRVNDLFVAANNDW